MSAPALDADALRVAARTSTSAFDADSDAAPARTPSDSTAAQTGRYEGSVRRDSDNATFLRAIELGTASGTSQPIRIFEQLGGTLPPTPQSSGSATVLGPLLLFNTSDSVAARRYICFALGNLLISASKFVFNDDRPDVNLVGLLKKV
jgi:hypothetical protein